jgi:tRNA(Ile)-lysidine synthase
MFRPGDHVGVAVSGGADSVCLLDVLVRLRPRWDLRLSVLHLNHNLRGEESREDAAFVARIAANYGLEARLADADLSYRRGNLEQAARRARLDFFRAQHLDRIATGHTRSDQAETVLHRFLRGSGTAGLSAIRPVTTDGLVRPLIDVERSEVIAYLRHNGLPWREDSSNASRDYLRNRIRHDLLPALIRDYNPSLVKTLAQTADWAQAEEAYWELHVPENGMESAKELTRMDRAVARRLVRRAIQIAKGDLLGIDFGHVERILDLAAAEEGHGRVQAPGVEVIRSFDRIRVARTGSSPQRDFRVPLHIPGSAAIPGGGTILVEVDESSEGGNCVYNGVGNSLDGERIIGRLDLRNWRPGDRYQPAGLRRPERIKKLFQEARVPWWERRGWPVVVLGQEIVWTRRFGPSAKYAAGPQTRNVLRVRELPYSVDT